MKLIDYLKLHDNICVDTCDTVFDETVTIDWDNESYSNPTDEYYKLVPAVYEKVDLVRCFDDAYAKMEIDWSGFIRNNKNLLLPFADEWLSKFELDMDEDDFVYEFIRVLHYSLGGNLGGEDFCKALREVVEKCEYKPYKEK